MNKLLLFFILILTACGPSAEEIAAQQESGIVVATEFPVTLRISNKDIPTGISVFTIDSCEYIYCESSGVTIIHKANCTNPIHIK